MKRKIFIGGWSHTGSRVLVELLRKLNYDTLSEKTNQFGDYLGDNFRGMFKKYYHSKDPTKIISAIRKHTKEKDSWVIKHGHLIMMIDHLKKEFPDAIFITTIRHPIDSLLKRDHNYKLLRGITTHPPELETKIDLYLEWYTNICKSDYIVKLEDLVFDKEQTITNLCDFLGCKNVNFKILKKIVRKASPSVGKYKTALEFIEECEQFPEFAKFVKNHGYELITQSQ